MPLHRRPNRSPASHGLHIVVCAYLALAIAYGVIAPPFELPDEIGHFFAVKYIADYGRLPVPDREPARHQYLYGQEGTQPPLYYLVGALLLRLGHVYTEDAWNYHVYFNPHTTCGAPRLTGNKALLAHDPDSPWRDSLLAFHLLRLYSTVLGLATVIGVWAIARLCFPDRPWVALLSTALTAFNPQFLFISAQVNNDNMVVALCTWSLYLILRSAYRGPTPATSVLTGVLIGLAALTKLAGILLLSLASLSILLTAWNQRRNKPARTFWSLFIVHCSLSILTAVAVSGWWYLHNALEYADPTLMEHHLAIVKRRAPMPLGAVLYDLPDALQSYWGSFTCTLSPGGWYYIFWGLAVLAGLGGLALYWRQCSSRRQWTGLAILVAWFFLVFVAWVRWDLIANGAQGRLLFPAIASASVLVGGGWSFLVGRKWWLGKALLLAWLGVALWVLVGLFYPAFAPPPRYASAEELDIPNRVDGIFGDRIALLGFDLQPASLEPGQTVEVTLYLSALRPLTDTYSMGLWLVSAVPGETDRLVGLDTWPGNGNYPTIFWKPGEVTVDTYRLRIPRDVPRAQAWMLQVNFYRAGERAWLPLSQNGQIVGNLAYLGWIRVDASEPPQIPPEAAPDAPPVFGQAIALRGARVVPVGGIIHVTLWWEALALPRETYTVFVHLLDGNGQLVGSGDGPPLRGGFPTQMWRPGDIVVDEHTISLPSDLPAGTYTVRVGWYDPITGARLPVDGGDGFMVGETVIDG